MENFWSILNERVPASTTMSQLNLRAREEWAAIDMTVLKNLICSMPQRLKNVVKMNGAHSGY